MATSKGCVNLIYFVTWLTERGQPNILIDDDHNAILCDFGLVSISADAESPHASISTSNSAGGQLTVRWMAPELLSIFDRSLE